MNDFITQILQKRLLIASAFLLAAILGVYSWQQLPVDAYPDIADVTVQVVTQIPGMAAEEMEQQISIPLERELNGIPGLHLMRSKSNFGISNVTLVFEDGVDDYWARQRVQEKINDIELPFGAQPGLNPLTSPTGEILRYVLQSETYSLRELTDIHKWMIIPRLKQISGVADVSNFGGITTQFQIEIDPAKLEKYNLSLSDVTEKIGKNNSNSGGSTLPRGDMSYIIRGIGLVSDLQDLGKVVVKTDQGMPVYINDLGTLKYGSLERKGIFSYADQDQNLEDGVEGIVQMLRHQNPSDVLKELHKAIEDLNQNILPEGVKIHIFLDRTNLVDNTLHTVAHTISFGILLVISILIIFLGSFRSALLVAITIPMSLLITFILMHLTNIPANLLSIGSIDFGIIVDGSIVMMESILKKRENNPEDELSKKDVVKRVVMVAKPVIFSTLIIITAYMPLFAFERIEKKLFTPMAFTVGYALIGALLTAMLLMPGLAYWMYRKPRVIKPNLLLEKLTIFYHRSTQRIIHQQKSLYMVLASVFLITVFLSVRVGKDFLPALDEGSIWLQVQLPSGISMNKAKDMSDVLRSRLLQYDEVTYVAMQTGRDDEGAESFSFSHIEASIGLKPYDEWSRGKRKADLIAEMENDLSDLPGYAMGFSQPIIDMVMDQIAGAHGDLAIKVIGEDFLETRRVAEEITSVIKKVQGASDVNIIQDAPIPQLQIYANRNKIAQYGLNVEDVNELIEVAIGGKAISQIYIENRSYDVICRYAEGTRDTPEKIGNLLLRSQSGTLIPLAQVTNIQPNTGASLITRENNKRNTTIRVNIRDRDITSFIGEARASIARDVKFNPDEVSISWGGQFENQMRAYSHLAVIVPLALLLMFLLLYFAFGNLRQALLLILMLPLALFGGMLALNIRGMNFDVSSAVGFIALFGVFIQNGVIMISHINQLRKEGFPLEEAVTEGSKHRLRPVLMTASVATFGLLPASLSTNIGSDVQRPLATVIVYGLLFGTLLTLYVLPSIYYKMEKRRITRHPEYASEELSEKS